MLKTYFFIIYRMEPHNMTKYFFHHLFYQVNYKLISPNFGLLIFLTIFWPSLSEILFIKYLIADPSCFYFRIVWILMEQHWFYFFCPLHLVQGLRRLEHWLLQKLSMKFFDQKFRYLIKNRYFGALIFQERKFFDN